MFTPTRATALASTVGDYRGWHLLVHCSQCRAMQMLPCSWLASEMRADTLLRDVLPRLRCQKCGDPPQSVKLSPGGGPSEREVWLLGSP
jgi:hypothetical protein